MSRNPRSLLEPFICRHCRFGTSTSRPRRIITSNNSRQFSKTSSRPTSTTDRSNLSFVNINNRSLIEISGPDAGDFLQNLLPAHLLPLEPDKTNLISTALLNAKGRIVHDIFIYKPTEGSNDRWTIDVDANSSHKFISLLRKHKLRSKIKIEELPTDSYSTVYIWPDGQFGDKQHKFRSDPRPGMGYRGYTSDLNHNLPDALSTALQQHGLSLQERTWEDYMIHRMSLGHAEGPIEIIPNHALPQESNFDFYPDGIDFHKGCYLGQELTIRTHHTGVVRKRILPVQIYTEDQPIPADQTMPIYNPNLDLPQPTHESNISKCNAKGRSARSTGKFLRGYGNIGLALCRLEMMTDLSLTAEGSNFDAEKDQFRVTWEEGGNDGQTTMRELRIKAFVPPWLRQSIEQSMKARSERSKRRKRHEEDEAEDDDEEDVD